VGRFTVQQELFQQGWAFEGGLPGPRFGTEAGAERAAEQLPRPALGCGGSPPSLTRPSAVRPGEPSFPSYVNVVRQPAFRVGFINYLPALRAVETITPRFRAASRKTVHQSRFSLVDFVHLFSKAISNAAAVSANAGGANGSEEFAPAGIPSTCVPRRATGLIRITRHRMVNTLVLQAALRPGSEIPTLRGSPRKCFGGWGKLPASSRCNRAFAFNALT